MVLFNQNHTIKRYNSPNEIIEEFYPIRLKIYNDRKEHMLKIIRADLNIIS